MDAMQNLLAQSAQLLDGSRLYRLQLPDSPSVVVERWQGREALSEGVDLSVRFLSVDANLPVQQWLAQPAVLVTRLADGSEYTRHALIAEAYCLGADGGMALYEVRLRDWTAWLQHGAHSRVFQDLGVRAIVDEVLGSAGIAGQWQWSEELDTFLANERPRSYCVQYRETDLAFVQRLLAEEGIGWMIEPAGEQGHRMRLFADSSLLPEAMPGQGAAGIRFHRADSTEADDSVQRLGRGRALTQGRLHLHTTDYRQVRSLHGSLPLQVPGDDALQEDYDPVGAYAFADQGELDRHARLMAEALEARAQRWQGHGSVRAAAAGQVWRLSATPGDVPTELLLVAVEHEGVNNLPVDARTVVDALFGGATDASEHAEAARQGYANRFTAVARSQRWRPILADGTGARRNPRPIAPGYQTAVVVAGGGQDGGELHADSLGRIKVRFHFQRGEGTQDSAWLRVLQRYAGPGVGSQFLPRIGQEVMVGFLEGDIDRPVVLGALFNGRGEAGIAPTPAGQGGQADTSLFAQAADASPSAQANLAGGHAPVWHAAGEGDAAHRNAGALWGLQSREWGGSGHSRLVFDDSDAQLRAQLATTQQTTQLSLGHLLHQADNYRGSFRGSGFELRSDAWGALRGEAGLWLTAYPHGETAPAGQAVQPGALMEQLRQLGETFAEASRIHVTVQPAAQVGVQGPSRSTLDGGQAPLTVLAASVRTTVAGKAFDTAKGDAPARKGAAGQGQVPHSGDPLLGLAAPAGVLQVAGQGIAWTTGETLVLGSGADSDAVVMGSARWHGRQAIGVLATAREGGDGGAEALSLVSGMATLELTAQADQLHIKAQQALQVASASAAVEVAGGKAVHLAVSGGASITLSGGNMVFNAPGNITVHAGRKSFVPGGRGNYPLPTFPASVCKECLLLAAKRAAPLTPQVGAA